MKDNRLEDYTEQEFLSLLAQIFDVKSNVDIHDDLIQKFEVLTQHPDGSDLIFYPEDGYEHSPEGVLKAVKDWRKIQGLPGFKPE